MDFGLILTLGSFLMLPTYAWPEVDHMNMCGSATKVVKRSGFKNWANYDRYVAKRGNGYYLRTNCHNVIAPVKKAQPKKNVVKKYYKKAAIKHKTVAKSSKSKAFKRTVKYDEKADCARVDRMNGSGNAVIAKRPVARLKYRNRPVKLASRSKVAKRKYNYFKKR